jgi:hypothetical protein
VGQSDERGTASASASDRIGEAAVKANEREKQRKCHDDCCASRKTDAFRIESEGQNINKRDRSAFGESLLRTSNRLVRFVVALGCNGDEGDETEVVLQPAAHARVITFMNSAE